MSFDIYLQRFSNSDASAETRERVREILGAYDYDKPDETGFYVVRFPDGVEVEWSAHALESEGEFGSCAFFVRRMSEPLIEFIFDVAKAADMVILPTMEDFVPILTSAVQRQQLPKELLDNSREPILCHSPKELGQLLVGGYGAWQRYRNQIVGPQSELPA